MADPTLNQLARENMGHVSEKVKEYSTKPNIPPRKSRSNNSITDATQNGNINHEASPTFGSRGRMVERKNKFRRSEPPSSFLQRVDSDDSVGPAAVRVSSKPPQEQTLQKAVCVTSEQKFETVTEIPSSDIQLQISDNTVSPRHSNRLSSPEILDSSFDETSDEDVITDRVMGKGAEPEPYSPPPPVKAVNRVRSNKRTRERSSVMVKSTGPSLSPIEHRKNLKTLSEHFRPSGSVSSGSSPSSLSRSQTFTDRGSQKMHQQQGSPHTTRYSSISIDTVSPNSATKLAEGFVFLEPQEVCTFVVMCDMKYFIYCLS